MSDDSHPFQRRDFRYHTASLIFKESSFMNILNLLKPVKLAITRKSQILRMICLTLAAEFVLKNDDVVVSLRLYSGAVHSNATKTKCRIQLVKPETVPKQFYSTVR